MRSINIVEGSRKGQFNSLLKLRYRLFRADTGVALEEEVEEKPKDSEITGTETPATEEVVKPAAETETAPESEEGGKSKDVSAVHGLSLSEDDCHDYFDNIDEENNDEITFEEFSRSSCRAVPRRTIWYPTILNGIDGGALSSDASIGIKAMVIMDRLAHGCSTIYDTLKEALESSKRKKKALNAFLSSYDEDEIENNNTLRDIKQARSDLITGRFNKLRDHIVHDNGRDIIGRHANDEFLEHNPAWKNALHEYGIAKVGHGPEDAVADGGSVSSKVSSLASRLTKSRSELISTVNQFVTEFGVNMSALVKTAENLALAFGKSVALDEATDMFLHTFERMNEFTNDRNGLYKHLLVLDPANVSSAEIKQRFLVSMTDLGSRAKALDEGGVAKHFAQACMAIVDTINCYSDNIKTVRDTVRANGGSTASMNELSGLSSTQLINITGMNNAIEELKVLLSKIQFFRNIAAFRSNLRQTTTELTEYTKDYVKSVGTAVCEAISKIKREKNESRKSTIRPLDLVSKLIFTTPPRKRTQKKNPRTNSRK
ncbi:unnamed protein product [Phytophthora fragariaefolia]|uniref:Unnamed protein product n=1 Tax=Phytophthora fragariaefolia TaxID=1490495 RepID=A0A9W6XN82_9STRA|nr:unnamed protein product [Phytophthora fragariaefolia]